MISLQMLLTAFGERLIRSCNTSNVVFQASGVLLLSADEALSEDFVYVADSASAAELLAKTGGGEGVVIFTSGDSPELEAACAKATASVCVTDMGFIELHNELFRQIEVYRGWQSLLALNSSKGILALLQNGGKLADASIYLLNPQRQIITGSTKPEFNERLRTVVDYEQSINGEFVRGMFAEIDAGAAFAFSMLGDGIRVCLAPVFNGRYLLGYLLAASLLEPGLLKQVLLQLAVSSAMVLSKSDVWSRGHISFQTLAQDLFSASPSNLEELQLRLQRLPHAPKKYMRCVIVRPKSGFALGAGKLLADAEKIFPTGNIAILGDEMVVLVSSDYSTCPLSCNTGDFESFLQKYDAHAMVSNPSKTPGSLRIMFRQALGVFDVALKVQYQMSGRIFYFERFSQYYIVDLCAKQAKAAFGTDDIVFLCNPGVLALTRYDRTNNSDLRDVMFNYLLNRCSVSKTAQALFMHRNTIIYKVNKIEEILGQSMDDPYLRHSLMFSCMLIRYRENYQSEDIQLSVFERTAP